MMLFTKKNVGQRGESLAARYLRRNGYRIIKRNARFGHYELDLIACDKSHITFVEVKTRAFDSVEQASLQRPSLAVDAGKRRRTLDAAYAYLRENPSPLCPRIDVIEVYLLRDAKRKRPLRIHHIKGAVDARGCAR